MRAADTYRAARREALKADNKALRQLGAARRGGGILARRNLWWTPVPHTQAREAARRLRQMEARRG